MSILQTAILSLRLLHPELVQSLPEEARALFVHPHRLLPAWTELKRHRGKIRPQGKSSWRPPPGRGKILTGGTQKKCPLHAEEIAALFGNERLPEPISRLLEEYASGRYVIDSLAESAALSEAELSGLIRLAVTIDKETTDEDRQNNRDRFQTKRLYFYEWSLK